MLLSNFNLMATAPGGVARLRELILTLAVQGKLVPQDAADEPASVLLQKIRAEKDRLIAAGKIRRDKPLAAIAEEEKPYELPFGWEWVRLGTLLNRLSNGYSGGQSKVPSPYPLSRIETISAASVNYKRVGYCENLSEEDIEKYRLVPGDILLSHINSDIHLGKTALVKDDRLLIHGVNLLLLRPSNFLCSNYVNLAITQRRFEGYFLSIAQHAIGQASINQSKLTAMLVALPPAAEQFRIDARVEELMRVCDALEAKGKLEAAQHAQLVSTLLGTLTGRDTPEALAQNWQRIATYFDVLLDRPQAVDAFEKTILQLALRGLLVPQDPDEESASILLQKIRVEKERSVLEDKIKRDKPLAEIAEEENPFELPVGWAWTQLGHLIRISSGDGLTAAQMAPNGHIPVYGGNGVNGHHDQSNVEKSTIVIGRVGYYCGSVHITPSRAWVTDNAFITRYPQALLDMKWLYWLLMGTNLKENDAATAQPVISGRKLYPIAVALPPLAEQSRIVARIEALRSLCAELRQRLSASQTTQAHLAEALVESVAG